jgi:cold-inducible RNA-binding protein
MTSLTAWSDKGTSEEGAEIHAQCYGQVGISANLCAQPAADASVRFNLSPPIIDSDDRSRKTVDPTPSVLSAPKSIEETSINIYVGNLPFSYDSSSLESLFSSYGAVHSAAVISDRETGRSRGFGFVEMADEDGRRAIEELNGKDIDGRRLTVNEARPRSGGGGGGGGGGRRFGGDRRR